MTVVRYFDQIAEILRVQVPLTAIFLRFSNQTKPK